MLFNFARFVCDKSLRDDFSSNDNCRMAAYFVLDGTCYVTKRTLQRGDRELHHRLPRAYGGKDTLENLVLLSCRIHNMVHTTSFESFTRLRKELSLTASEVDVVNQLRYEAHRTPYYQ